MDILNQIVEKLTKDELRFLKYYYGTKPGEQRKDAELVDYFRKSGKNFNEDQALKKLKYSPKEKNSYYRLKNRVIQDIGDSLSLLLTHKNDLYELLHYLTLYHIYNARGLYKTCLVYLKKAERIGLRIESYELLDQVYAGFIRLSSDVAELNPEPYIKQREQNAVLVSQLRELDNALASVSYRLKLSQNFGPADGKVLQQLHEYVVKISKQTTSKFSRNLQTRIYRALSQILLQQHNYPALEKLVHDNLQRFEVNKWFDKDNHDLKLQMLTYLANSLYKNGKYQNSLQYTAQLGEELDAFNRMHHDRFLFFFYNLLILNNAPLNPAKALKALDEFEGLMRRKKNYYYDVFIYLNRAGVLYDTGKYNEALKSLVKLYVNDSYQNADVTFRFKVEVSELIITYEARDYNTLLYRIEQVKKDYKGFARQKSYTLDFDIIKLLGTMAVTDTVKRNESIQKEIKRLLKASTKLPNTDAEIIRYEGWLQKGLSKA